MYLKLIGACLTIAGTGTLGFYVGNRYLKRVQDLEKLITILNEIKTEMRYRATPLPEILEKIVKSSDSQVNALFNLKEQNLSVNASLIKAIETGFPKTALQKREQELLYSFAQKVGTTDIKDQENLFNYIIEQLKLILTESRSEAEKNVKLVNYLGVLAGAFLVLLFF